MNRTVYSMFFVNYFKKSTLSFFVVKETELVFDLSYFFIYES